MSILDFCLHSIEPSFPQHLAIFLDYDIERNYLQATNDTCVDNFAFDEDNILKLIQPFWSVRDKDRCWQKSAYSILLFPLGLN